MINLKEEEEEEEERKVLVKVMKNNLNLVKEEEAQK